MTAVVAGDVVDRQGSVVRLDVLDDFCCAEP
jgi:hypothetical protein